MSNSAKHKKTLRVPLKTIQRAVSDGTRWRIFGLLLDRGPLTTELIARSVGAPASNVSKHLVFLREAGLLEHRLGRIYAIPDAFLVPGERALDFGPLLARFDREE